ncbi:CLUMA_CG015990, isoform A [Clunio marinus]|uniref:CLUMA_CG015990, isoform A n=1 Tax=Clunio marinus TaxID=568069 RepID=A0A1J1IUA9_9DIPT|nr:CLUMA_CG015990, isoform A [Clunio marinus]
MSGKHDHVAFNVLSFRENETKVGFFSTNKSRLSVDQFCIHIREGLVIGEENVSLHKSKDNDLLV